jgi:hypothetical protein
MRLSGKLREHPLEVLLLPNGTSQLRMKVRASLPAGLHLGRQEPGARRLQLRDMQDIQVGDRPLDDAVIVQARNPAATIRLLREPGVREVLLSSLTENPRTVVTGGEVVLPLSLPLQEASCRRALDGLERLTSTLEKAATQQQSRVATAREQLRAEAPPPSPTAPLPVPAPSPQAEELEQFYKKSRAPAEFARRVLLHRWVGQVPAMTGFVVLASAKLARHHGPILGYMPSTWRMVGLGLLVVGVAGLFFGYFFLLRCPACGLQLMLQREESSILDTTGLLACPRCNTRLR